MLLKRKLFFKKANFIRIYKPQWQINREYYCKDCKCSVESIKCPVLFEKTFNCEFCASELKNYKYHINVNVIKKASICSF